MSYRVELTQTFFVDDLTLAREKANTLISIVEPVENVTHNYAHITDMDTLKRIPLSEPAPSVGFAGRQDRTTDVMELVKELNKDEQNTHPLSEGDVAEQAVVLPEGQREYIISFKVVAEALASVRPDVKSPKEINALVKQAWVKVMSERASKISFK